MPRNILRQRMETGMPVYGVFVTMTDPAIVELVALAALALRDRPRRPGVIDARRVTCLVGDRSVAPRPLVDRLVLTSCTLTTGQTLCVNFDSSCRSFLDQ